jgi:hypothetical protein
VWPFFHKGLSNTETGLFVTYGKVLAVLAADAKTSTGGLASTFDEIDETADSLLLEIQWGPADSLHLHVDIHFNSIGDFL